jgi:hypothetical protein
MGLDQYLYAKRFASPTFREDGEIYSTVVKAVGADLFNRPDDKGFKCAVVSVQVGYWRKANAVHQWFVDNCQGGEDDCRESYVDRAQLEELRDVCKEVLADKTKADDLLPTSAGFFFGTTDYDEWYFGSLKETVEIIDHVLTNIGDEWTFYYNSSW